MVLYYDEYYRLIYESMKLFPFLFATRNPTSSPSYPCDLGHLTVKALLVPGSSMTSDLSRLFTVSIQDRPSCHDKNSIEIDQTGKLFRVCHGSIEAEKSSFGCLLQFIALQFIQGRRRMELQQTGGLDAFRQK